MAVVVLAAAGAWLTLRPGSAGQPATVAGEGGCRIRMDRFLELGGDRVDRGLVTVGEERVYLVAAYARHEVAVYDRDGRFLRVVGRQGGGPGEYGTIKRVIPLPAGGLTILSTDPPRLTVLDPGGEVTRMHPVPVSVDFGGAIRLPDGGYLLAGQMVEHQARGSPFLRLDADGAVVTHYGENEVETEGPLAGMMVRRVLAHHPRHGAVTLKGIAYEFEFWSDDGTLRDTWTEDPDWFRWPPEIDRAGVVAHRLGPPEDAMWGLQFDGDGRLWLLAKVTPDEWEEGIEDGRLVDREAWSDFRVEVIDVAERRVLCARRIKPDVLTGFAGPRMMATYDEDVFGRPRIHLWRLSLVQQ